MGQGQSTSIPFVEIGSLSTISSTGQLKCKKSCKFTQCSQADLSTDCELRVKCKVLASEGESIGFGLLPAQQTSSSRSHHLGESYMPGSIGCFVTPDAVQLVKEGKCFFVGSFKAGEKYSITLEIQRGKLKFFVGSGKVNSEELAEMTFDGSYKIGVSMAREGQKVDVFFDCPVTFADTWSAGSCDQGMLFAKETTDFTFFSNQLVRPTDQYNIMARVVQSCGNSVGLGTVPSDCLDLCRCNLVGTKPGSIGCIVKDGTIRILIDGNGVFLEEITVSDPCVIGMTVEKGRVSFHFNGKLIDCSELKENCLTESFRLGVGLSSQGQLVEMRGDGQIPDAASPPSRSDGTESLDVSALTSGMNQQALNGLAELLAAALASDGNSVRWKDNMRSVDCNRTDLIAVGVKKFTATLFTHKVVAANQNESVDIRILNLEPGQLMMVGVMNENTANHANHHLGAALLRNSLGLSSRGDILLDGAIFATGKGFRKGDLISVGFNGGTLSIKVNGTEAVPELGNLNFKSKFRWAVSFTDVGQAVKLGGCDLTEDEAEFCRSKGVEDPRTEVVSSQRPIPASTNTVTSITIASSVSSSGKSEQSAATFSKEIASCYIDEADLQYGGKTLGQGRFGRVYKGTWDDSEVAIKEMPWDDDDIQRQEIVLGRSLTQPNIATILGWARKDDKLLIVSPLLSKGSLADRLAQLDPRTSPSPSTGGQLGPELTFQVGLGLLRAIKYMASRKPNPVVHGDIKPGNVLLDDQDRPVLADFGTARSVRSTLTSTATLGTPLYMASEQVGDRDMTPSTDVHGVALVTYEVLCAPRRARNFTNLLALVNAIDQGTLPPMDDVPENISHVLKPALDGDPYGRPSASQMLDSWKRCARFFEEAGGTT